MTGYSETGKAGLELIPVDNGPTVQESDRSDKRVPRQKGQCRTQVGQDPRAIDDLDFAVGTLDPVKNDIVPAKVAQT